MTPIKSDEFWEEEGDIIMSVTEDGVETHFRIHRALLLLRSPVFREMISMGPPPPEWEALPYPFQDDSLHDVKALLVALYYPQPGRPRVPLTFDMILGTMRLSHKYQMEVLQRGIRKTLGKLWPVKFSDLMARLSDIGCLSVAKTTALIETAQRCQANEFLPAAFYELASAWVTRREEIISIISPDNLARLSVGRARSEQRLRTIQDNSSDQMWQPSLASRERTIFHHRLNFPRCHKYPSSWCTTIIPAFRSKVAPLLHGGIFAIPAIQQCKRTDLGNGCEPCKDWFMDVLRDKIEELWDNIPIYFNLADPEVDSSNALLRSANT